MSKVLKIVAVVASIAATVGSLGAFGGIALAIVGAIGTVAALGSQLLAKQPKGPERQAQELALTLGEQPRTVLFGKAATGGGLVDAFNYGGKYGTDWECVIIALADHECQSLEGFYVNDDYKTFSADGDVAGFNGKLKVWWRPGTETQVLPSIITTNGAGWTASDNLAGISFVTVAYKADEPDEKSPTWPGGRPSFLWVVKGKKCYDPRKDSTVTGGSGSHRWGAPSTWEWTDNAAICRYNFNRGIYALNKVTQPDQRILGRGLSTIEAPPARAMVWANLCDELVPLKAGGSEKRYTVNGVLSSDQDFLTAEQKFASAMGGIIMQPEGSIEVEPGHAKTVIADFTDDDILNLEAVTVEKFRSEADAEWCNMVVPRYVEPTQKWKMHGAPIRRVYADVIEDGGIRELPVNLELVTSRGQAQRCGEIERRMGRLFTTGQLVLPPRFIHVEEGDWIGWTSQRHFGGARKIFRVEKYNRTEKWHMSLVLREINGGVFSWNAATDELESGAEATDQAPPPAVGQPGASAWALTAGTVASPNGQQPSLVISGAVDDSYASAVRFEYKKTSDTEWIDAGSAARNVTRKVIAPVSPSTAYQVAVSYTVDGEASDRRVYGPVTTGALLIDFDNIGGATKDELLADINAAYTLAASKGKIFNIAAGAPLPSAAASNVGDTAITANGTFYERVNSGGILLDGKVIVLDGKRPRLVWTPWAVQPVRTAIDKADDAAADANAALLALESLDDDGILSINEKITRLIPLDAELEGSYQTITASAGALGLTFAALTAARTDWLNARNAITPAWNDISQPSPVARNSLDSILTAYRYQIEQLRKAIEAKAATVSEWAGVSGAGKPEDNATRNRARGIYDAGTAYSSGDSIVWRVEDGGTGHNYTRIGAGDTTGTSPSDGSKWALTVERGQDGPQGPQGVPGSPGADGSSRYSWIAYADNATGTVNFTNGDPGDRKYIGIAANKASATESTSPGEYTWSKFVGDDGAQGIPGTPGADGTPRYIWIAYANSADGTIDFTNGSPGTRAFIGIAENKLTVSESGNPADYNWSRIKGDQGVAGVDGVDGQDGKLVEYIFTRSVAKPAVATGNGIPAGTYDDPEDAPGNSPLWIAKGKQELDGTLIGTWGDWVPYGEQDKIHIVSTLAEAEAAGALVGQRALLPDLTLYQRVSNTGILLDGKIIVLGGFRPSIKWTPTQDQPFRKAASTATIGKDGLIYDLEGGPTPVDNRLQAWDDVTGSDKPENNADVTANAVPYHQEVAARQYLANYKGVLTSGQLPDTMAIKRFKGDNDVSSSATWTIESQGGITGVTVTVTNGVVTIPDGAEIPASGTLLVKSLRDSFPLFSVIGFSRKDEAPPITNGGGTTVSDNTLSNVTDITKIAISDEMTVKTGAAGVIDFSGVLSIIAAKQSPPGLFGVDAQWQYKEVGGTFTNVGAADISATFLAFVEYEPPNYFGSNGSINVAVQKTGLTTNTDFIVRLMAARDDNSPPKTIGFGGTVYAAGS